MTADELLVLAHNGGSIVCTSQLRPEEIAKARADGHLYVNGDGLGFAYVKRTSIVRKIYGITLEAVPDRIRLSEGT
jgi:hypothetical protein